MQTQTKVDSQNVILKQGQKVAYNMSGRVVPGIIFDIRNNHILVHLQHYNIPLGHLSKVKDGSSLLVISG